MPKVRYDSFFRRNLVENFIRCKLAFRAHWSDAQALRKVEGPLCTYILFLSSNEVSSFFFFWPRKLQNILKMLWLVKRWAFHKLNKTKSIPYFIKVYSIFWVTVTDWAVTSGRSQLWQPQVHISTQGKYACLVSIMNPSCRDVLTLSYIVTRVSPVVNHHSKWESNSCQFF